MLARNNKGTIVQPEQETIISKWIADGVRYLIGFNATGSWSAEFRMYVRNLTPQWWDANFPNQTFDDSNPWYAQQVHPNMRNAYIADRGILLPANAEVTLCVFHEAPGEQIYKGTILGG